MNVATNSYKANYEFVCCRKEEFFKKKKFGSVFFKVLNQIHSAFSLLEIWLFFFKLICLLYIFQFLTICILN